MGGGGGKDKPARKTRGKQARRDRDEKGVARSLQKRLEGTKES